MPVMERRMRLELVLGQFCELLRRCREFTIQLCAGCTEFDQAKSRVPEIVRGTCRVVCRGARQFRNVEGSIRTQGHGAFSRRRQGISSIESERSGRQPGVGADRRGDNAQNPQARSESTVAHRSISERLNRDHDCRENRNAEDASTSNGQYLVAVLNGPKNIRIHERGYRGRIAEGRQTQSDSDGGDETKQKARDKQSNRYAGTNLG